MPQSVGTGEENETKLTLENDVDALFKLPLAEFTVARNALAARLKKAGSRGEAERVKTMNKPSISAWAVNQLHWKHGDAFKGLIATGERFASVHASQSAGDGSIRELLAARREALSVLTGLAAELLREAGHNPAPETMRRITTALEALSAHAPLSKSITPGRLTADIDPPGFESLANLIPSVNRVDDEPITVIVPIERSAARVQNSLQEPDSDTVNLHKEERRARISLAKTTLRAAEDDVSQKQAIARDAAAALEEATAQSNEAEEHRRDAEQRFQKASIAAEAARQRVRGLAAEAEKAAVALQDAERHAKEARKNMNALSSIQGSKNGLRDSG